MSFAEHIDFRAVGYEGLKGSDVVIITAGRNRRPDESRLDLAKANVGIMEGIADEIKRYADAPLVIVVANPMDVLTYVAYKRLGYDKGRVIGSGTVLDSSRFKFLLSEEFEVDPRNIHAYILGEHGDSSFPVWSMANLGQIPVQQYLAAKYGDQTEAVKDRIFQAVIAAGKEVIRRKGATYFAIAMSVARILEAIVRDEKSILTVSSYIDQRYFIRDICLSLPAVMTRNGIREIMPVNLNEKEYAQLTKSSEVLRQMVQEIGY